MLEIFSGLLFRGSAESYCRDPISGLFSSGSEAPTAYCLMLLKEFFHSSQCHWNSEQPGTSQPGLEHAAGNDNRCFRILFNVCRQSFEQLVWAYQIGLPLPKIRCDLGNLKQFRHHRWIQFSAVWKSVDQLKDSISTHYKDYEFWNFPKCMQSLWALSTSNSLSRSIDISFTAPKWVGDHTSKRGTIPVYSHLLLVASWLPQRLSGPDQQMAWTIWIFDHPLNPLWQLTFLCPVCRQPWPSLKASCPF